MPSKKAGKIAPVVHEAMRAYAKSIGQPDMPAWGRAPKWMKESTFQSVEFVLKNPDVSAGSLHDQWADAKRADGWKYGKIKDPIKKTHPMLVPFSKLPKSERVKDDLVNAIVRALT